MDRPFQTHTVSFQTEKIKCDGICGGWRALKVAVVWPIKRLGPLSAYALRATARQPTLFEPRLAEPKLEERRLVGPAGLEPATRPL